MNISTSSWHYRLLALCRLAPSIYRTTTICAYMRRLFLMFTLGIDLLLYIPGTIVVIHYWYDKHPPLWFAIYAILWILTTTTLGLISVALLIGGLCFLYMYLEEHNKLPSFHRGREPSIFKTWYQNLHGHICTLVEFTE